jgi:hypothetical protein
MTEALNDYRKPLKCLMNISVFSLNAAAKRAGLNAAAVSRYLSGENALGGKNQKRLLRVLGVNDTTKMLDPTKVHVWLVGNQLDDLRVVLDAFTDKQELKVRKVQVEGMPISHPDVAADEDTFLLSGDHLSVVIIRTLSDGDPKPTSINPQEFGAGIEWWINEAGEEEEASVGIEEWGDWLKGKISQEQFDAALGRPANHTWSDVRNLAQQTGTRVGDLIAYLKAAKAKQRLDKKTQKFFSDTGERE